MSATLCLTQNGNAIRRADIPLLSPDRFQENLVEALDSGWRVVSYFGVPEGGELFLHAVLSSKKEGTLGVVATSLEGKRSFPSLTPCAPQVHLFEREIAEEYGVTFEGHPWPKPVRFQGPLTSPGGPQHKPVPIGVMDFYRVEGSEIHEVAVGPVHAGIIEPGHFRFQCHGEEVLHLEISLGYQHRGLERRLVGKPSGLMLKQMETIAGDTTIGHTLCYAMVIEGLAGARVPARGHVIRGIAMELERLANHTGDLGAISGDVGYLPTASFCGRIRGDFLNLTAEICGSRFGRSLVVPGGVNFDLTSEMAAKLTERLRAAGKDLAGAVQLLWDTPSVMARLEGTGTVSDLVAAEIGLVGPAARACGLNRDIRRDHPFGIYSMSQIPVVTARTGDVYARTLVRWLEAEKSLEFIEEQLHQLPGVSVREPVGAPAPESLAVALTEGWRGEVCHVALTDHAGAISRYKVTDPSFHNWTGLSLALRGVQISDFPLCNKSFNLSYCGFDL
ncbi:hydrogenase large subunit [Geomesophilobacter sediminis]|uniref:NADH-quinone oxidoreductase subunit C n=1 Tax=Geomesophilobacter sediminis TaxID=2798584 RepID=A0A8J7SB55_9BACT|nr:NADH-quinone oxidoreductase subunit C [Geomesophilobacter sediminis]MBJ6727870.1 NADH-quinone oxidoreductase subunit C [Geomesophilobacter sediminis]